MSNERTSAEMIRLDLKKELKHLYNPSAREVTLVDVPEMNFLMLDGRGDPNTAQEYKDAVEALYSVAYTLKFMLKKEAALDYVVMPLEGLWWAEGGREAPREEWQWTMMIRQPEQVSEAHFARALAQARQKKQLPALDKLRLEALREGTAAQIMHIGPFAAEETAIAKIVSFTRERGYEWRGKHHEIYLSDPRRTAPEKMRTVLREAVRKIE